MTDTTLGAVQGPLKQQYREDPGSAVVTLRLGALAACAGVTLSAVATSLGIEVRGGNVTAEGELDFRGTLAVDKEAPVGFSDIRLSFELDTDADADQLATLEKLTERYCVVLKTIQQTPHLTVSTSAT